jgi:hypothetical protein
MSVEYCWSVAALVALIACKCRANLVASEVSDYQLIVEGAQMLHDAKRTPRAQLPGR